MTVKLYIATPVHVVAEDPWTSIRVQLASPTSHGEGPQGAPLGQAFVKLLQVESSAPIALDEKGEIDVDGLTTKEWFTHVLLNSAVVILISSSVAQSVAQSPHWSVTQSATEFAGVSQSNFA